ncbi:signal peptidase I [Pseudoxanthomonas putridarboris]|uniref:Signal peptidase I n=1 Tax=Pseudoxanthomonas putridarboris TaxID=752605 RepID=A0ABU9J5W6_9GAMM
MTAHTTSPRRPSDSLRHWLRSELPRLLLFVGLLLAARSSLANHYVVPSTSMQPNLQAGDRVAVDMRAYGLRTPLGNRIVWPVATPARGDVVVFDSPRDGERLIKRVVAVAGDEVVLREGRLALDGVPRSLPGAGGEETMGRRIVPLDLTHGGGPDIDGLKVPAGKVLVLGDHRGNSLDGRYFGLVDADAIYGRAVAVYYRRGNGLVWKPL